MIRGWSVAEPAPLWGSKTQRRSPWLVARYVDATSSTCAADAAPQTPPLGQHHRLRTQQFGSTPRVAEHPEPRHVLPRRL